MTWPFRSAPQPTRPCPVCQQASATAYWRNAYETLVRETGRDLNDGLGRDPRSRKSTEPQTQTKAEGVEGC